MIGRLKGVLAQKQPPQLLLDVNGVGYEVEAPMSTFYALPETGAAVTLHTHLVVRDDAHILFGFASDAERQMFRTLIKINGVGAKLALTILSGMSTDELRRCVDERDTATLIRLPGVGRKTAERLLVEMAGRLDDLPILGGTAKKPANASNDALDALIALGYKAVEAERMLRGMETDGMSSEQIIRQALQGSVNR
jgi:Holliday junction DNA helicase RuvA